MAQQSSISLTNLLSLINSATDTVKAKLDEFKTKGSSVSIADMFEMQMLMNSLSQLSEMSTSVVAAANASTQSMARAIKS